MAKKILTKWYTFQREYWTLFNEYLHTIEKFVIELLESQDFSYIYAPETSHDSDRPERRSYENVLLLERLREALLGTASSSS